jgi:hypothetical protein
MDWCFPKSSRYNIIKSENQIELHFNEVSSPMSAADKQIPDSTGN